MNFIRSLFNAFTPRNSWQLDGQASGKLNEIIGTFATADLTTSKVRDAIERKIFEIPYREQWGRIQRAKAALAIGYFKSVVPFYFPAMVFLELNSSKSAPEAMGAGEIREALQLLQSRQGFLDRKQIDQAVKEFKQYFSEVSTLPTGVKTRAQQFLTKHFDLNSSPQVYEIYEGMVRRIHDGRELIARMWNFAKQQSDQDHCKEGIIRALSRSFQTNDSNPMRIIDHMILCVLQGRLHEVSPEGACINQIVETWENQE